MIPNPSKRISYLCLLLLTVLLSVSRPVFADARKASTDQEIAEFFDQKISATMKELEIPGGAVIVVRGGRTIFSKGYGVADIASRRPVDVEKTVFRAASISKLIPWLAVMQLAQEGKLDLDRDVNAYLDFAIPAKYGAPITMRHLMTHTAGFPERFHGVFDQDLSKPLGQMLRENIPQRIYPPGTTSAYSNYGAALAGYIVERLRQRPWAQVATERILMPIGMDHSTVLQPVPPALRADLASTYSYGDPRPGEFRVTPLAPMGSLSPTAGDMGRLLAMLLRDGQGERGQILSPATLQQMFILQQALGPGLPDGFGLGFLVGEYHGIHYAGHAGNMSTLATDLEVLPEQRLGWYYVFNSQGKQEGARHVRDELLRAVIDRFLAEGAQPTVAHGPSSAQDVAGGWISTRRLAGGPLAFSGLLNTTHVEANHDGSLDIESSGQVTHWLPEGRDRFVEQETGIPLAVRRDQNGKPARLGSEALYPAAEFERPPGFIAAVPFIAGFSFGTFLLAMIVRPVAAWIARRRGQRSPAQKQNTPRLRQWACRSFWLIVLSLLGWGLFGLMLAIDFSNLFKVPAAVHVVLGLLSLATAVWAAVMVADAVMSWTDSTRSLLNRSASAIVSMAAVGIAILFYYLDVINLTTNW